MRQRTGTRTSRTTTPLAAILLSLLVTVSFATASWAVVGWYRIPHDPAVFGSTGHALMFDVAPSSHHRLVAVGTATGTGGGAAIWLSNDGATWSRVPYQADFTYGIMTGVAQGPSDMVVVGFVDTPMGVDAAVWTGHALTWSRIPHDPAVFGGFGEQYMSGVCAGGPGLVVVGYDDDYTLSTDAAVWTSPDGTTWTRVPHDEAVMGGQGSLAMYGVVAGGPGLVAVGYDDSDGDADAAVWTSEDGLTWARVPHSETVFGGPSDQKMNSVAVGDDGQLVAVGVDFGIDDGVAAVWTSTDGVSWTRVARDDEVFGGPGNQSMNDVVTGGPGYVAVGNEFHLTYWLAAAWTSADGIVWKRENRDSEIFGGAGQDDMGGVTVDEKGLVVAVGRAGPVNHLVAAVWTNDSWLYPSFVAPAPGDGPYFTEGQPWVERPIFLAMIACCALVFGFLGWRFARRRRSKR